MAVRLPNAAEGEGMAVLPVGKLDLRLLRRLLEAFGSAENARVVVGPAVGEDAAVLATGDPGRYLVAKTDPVTFATEEIGWYAVHINANDVAIRGAQPRWFQAAILLPEGKTTEELVERVFRQVAEACRGIGASLVGGHTEISHGLERPLVIGSMLGEVEREKLVTTEGAQVGDAIIMTKGVVIEGTAVIAREKGGELRAKGYEKALIQRATEFLYDPGISVVEDARLALEEGVHAMHDPTEGGLLTGIYEMMEASGKGMVIDADEIPILPEAQLLCEAFGLDPLRTITSGTLLLAADAAKAQRIVSRYRDRGILAAAIGEVREKHHGRMLKRGDDVVELVPHEQDEVARLFS